MILDINIDLEIYLMNYPYKAVIHGEEGRKGSFWWPVSSDPEDDMIVGDGIPGDEKTAEFAARCCNIVYRQAISDVVNLLNTNELLSLNLKNILGELTGNK